MSVQIHYGDILYSESREKLITHEASYIVVKDGLVEGIYKELPQQYKDLPVTDHGRGVIIPAFSDLHVHASQYNERALGMDCLLSDWLNNYTFPQEANFKDMEYAKNAYDAFVDELIKHGTFHVVTLATIHRHTTNYLFNKLEEKGLYAYVGKVQMDMDSPEYLCETTEESYRETEEFLKEHIGATKVKPIITPRFGPTCTDECINGGGELSRKYGVGMQTHIVESLWEAQASVDCHPGNTSDSGIYEKAGMLESGPNVFAHVIFPTEDDIRVMTQYNAIAVHCPHATNNVVAGIMPVNYLQEKGVNVALGTDVGGGHTLALYKQISKAVQLSKLKEFYEPETNKPINFANAFYCATKVGGSIFGKMGSLEPGYHFNALVINGMEDKGIQLTPSERVERFCYIGDDRNIVGRFIDGEKIDV